MTVTMVDDDTDDVEHDARLDMGGREEGKKRTLVSNNPLLMSLIFDADGQVNCQSFLVYEQRVLYMCL